MSQRIEIKNKDDLVKVFGKSIADLITKDMRKGFMKRLPFSVYLSNEKPKFYLDDGGMLHAFAVDLSSRKILDHKYCGSADSAFMHTKEQFGEGQKAPGEVAIFFLESSPSSGNHPWSLTVVSNNIVEQLEGNRNSPKASV